MLSRSDPPLPQIPFGKYSLSRLIVGSNPVNSYSHNSRFLDLRMGAYFTRERTLELLSHCQELGINTWQANSRNLEAYQAYRDQGGEMHLISVANDSESDPNMVERLAAGGAIAIAHHGGVTDRLWKAGRIDEVRDFCRRVRDTGVMVGVSMHMPVVLDHAESEDWDVDFYMCCLYEVTRDRAMLSEIMPQLPVLAKEMGFMESDPARVFATMRRTSKPCLAFKLLAAGRLCDNQETVEKAFESTLVQLEPTNAVIVGMYPEYEDQVAANVEYVRRYSDLSK